MDIEKLAERLGQEAYGSDIEDLLLDAATAIETLRAENVKLQYEEERQRGSADDMRHLCENAERAYTKAQADLARVTAERDAYKTYFNDLSSKPCCNTCENKDCEYKPRVGDTVRANCPLYSGPEADRLRAENEQLRERVRQLETRARTERCDAADYDCRELGALRREVSALRERLADPPKKEE